MVLEPFLWSLGLSFYCWPIPLCLLSLFLEFAIEKPMFELVTKVSGYGAPPLILFVVTVQHDNMHVWMTRNLVGWTTPHGPSLWSCMLKKMGSWDTWLQRRNNQLFLILSSLLGWSRMSCWFHGFLFQWLRILVLLSLDFI